MPNPENAEVTDGAASDGRFLGLDLFELTPIGPELAYRGLPVFCLIVREAKQIQSAKNHISTGSWSVQDRQFSKHR